MEQCGHTIEEVKTSMVKNVLQRRGLEGQHDRTIQRALCALRKKSEEKVLESDQRIESYFKDLNANNQYAVLLYSNNELIVPSAGEEFQEKNSKRQRAQGTMCEADKKWLQSD